MCVDSLVGPHSTVIKASLGRHSQDLNQSADISTVHATQSHVKIYTWFLLASPHWQWADFHSLKIFEAN